MMMILLDIFVIGFLTIIGTIYLATGWAIFDKAGKPGWALFVPIYNTIVALQICGKPTWWLLFFLVPCVWTPIFSLLLTIELANRFGRGGGFIAGLILLPALFFPILAFGKSEYTAPQPA